MATNPATLQVMKNQIAVTTKENLPTLLSEIVNRCVQLDAFNGKNIYEVVRTLEATFKPQVRDQK